MVFKIGIEIAIGIGFSKIIDFDTDPDSDSDIESKFLIQEHSLRSALYPATLPPRKNPRHDTFSIAHIRLP